MLAEPSSSASGGGVATFLQILDHFLFDVLAGSGPNLTSGMNGICSTSFVTIVINGINVADSSMMVVGEGVSTLDSTTMILLDIEMTIICEKSPWLLQVQTK